MRKIPALLPLFISDEEETIPHNLNPSGPMLKMNSKGAGEMTILCLLEKVVSLSSFSRHTPPLPYPNPWIALFFLLLPEVVWCAVPQWASGLHSLHSPALPVDSLRSWRWWCATDPFQTAVPRFKSIIRPDVVSAHVHKMVLNNSRWHPPLKLPEISLWRLLLVHISECSFLYPPHDRFNCTLNRIEKAPVKTDCVWDRQASVWISWWR